MLDTSTIVAWVVGTFGESNPLPIVSVVLRYGLSIIESNVVDAVALPMGGILEPSKVLLGMAGDLQWCPGDNKILRDALPIATTIHF